MFIEFVGTTALKGGVRPPGMSAVQIAEANALTPPLPDELREIMRTFHSRDGAH
jgi:hypothetical protein